MATVDFQQDSESSSGEYNQVGGETAGRKSSVGQDSRQKELEQIIAASSSSNNNVALAQQALVEGQTPSETDSEVNMVEDDDCEEVSNCGGALQIRAESAVLHARATDCSGNVGTCSVNLCESDGGGGPQRATEQESRRPGATRSIGLSGSR